MSQMRHQSSPKSFASSKDRLESWHKQCVSRNTTFVIPRVDGLLHHIGSALTSNSSLECARAYSLLNALAPTESISYNINKAFAAEDTD